MLLWFVGLGVLLVWVVFQSPALDVRRVAAGLLMPWLDGLTGGPFVLHTLVASVALLAVVLVTTTGQRRRRRTLLGLPIGTFLHLVLDGTFTRTELFWWPLGAAGAFDGRLPALARSPGLLVAQELAGAAALWWAYRAFGLADPDRRADLRRTGRLRATA